MQQTTDITQDLIDSHLAEVLHHGEPKDVFFFLRFVQNPNVPMVNERFGSERLPIWTVMSGEHMHVNAAALLKLHPDVNVTNALGQNPAMKAFEEKHAGLGLMFLKAGTDLSARDNNGVGLLKYIVDAGYPDALQEALHKGLDINQTAITDLISKDNHTFKQVESGALAWAIANENWDILHVLIDNGIDRDLQNPAVRTAMNLAQAYAQVDPHLRQTVGPDKYRRLELLARQKSDAFMRVITDGVFPNDYTFEGLCKDNQTFQKRLSLLPLELQEKVLFETGLVRVRDQGLSEDKKRQLFIPLEADEKLVFPSDKSMQQVLDTVLINDIKYGEPKDVYMWLKLGADPNATEEKGGKPALFAAVEENLLEMKVAQKKEEITRTAKYNGVVPHLAKNIEAEFVAWKESPYQKVKHLLDFGANPNTVHKLQKLSVLERAYGKGRLGIVQLLKKHGAQVADGLLTYTAQYGEAQSVEDLFKPYQISQNGRKITRLRLLSDAQIKKESLTALKIAVERGKPRMVNVFYEQGLVPPLNSKEGQDLLNLAEGDDKSLVVRALKGTYSIQPHTQKPLSLQEKINELSGADVRRLTTLLGLSDTREFGHDKPSVLQDGTPVEQAQKVPSDTTKAQSPASTQKRKKSGWALFRRLGGR